MPLCFMFDQDADAKARLDSASGANSTECRLTYLPRPVDRPMSNRLLDIVADKDGLVEAVDKIAEDVRERRATHVASIGARGWLLGAAAARRVEARFAPVLRAGRATRNGEKTGSKRRAAR